MDPFEYLLTCAEIGIALAGFAALMVALRERGGGNFSEQDRNIVSLLVERSLIATFLSLHPGVLHGLEIPNEKIALLSSAIFVIFSIYSARRAINVHRSDPNLDDFISSISRRILWVAFLVVVSIQVANVIGGVFERSVWWYVLAILWVLVSAGWLFLLFVRSWVRAN